MDDMTLTIGVLKDALSVPISTEIPPNRPSQLIMVAQTGDSSTDFIHNIEVSMTCWGTSDLDARNLAMSAVHALSDAAQSHALLSHVSLQSITRDEWLATGQSRYMAVVDLTINV